MNSRRVVVTGLGVISPIGVGKNEFWNNLTAGKSGISEITSFNTTEYKNHRGGEIRAFDPKKFLYTDELKMIGRTSQFIISATKLALKDASVPIDLIRGSRVGVITGTTMADCQRLEEMDKIWVESGEKNIDSAIISQYPGNTLSSNVSFYLGLEGVSLTVPTACSAGAYSIGYSYDLIKTGKANMMIAGGADSFSKVAFAGFNRLFAVAPEKCQPFDMNRKGMMVSEGAGILLLESLESAMQRSANIYAEISGYALSCDAHHMTAPSPEGIALVMRRALRNSRVKEDEVDYISAHGTGTIANDKAECQAVGEVFGDRYKKIPMSSIKSMLGHTMGAASAIEAIACCLAMKEDVVPPTINYTTPDPDCDIDCVPNKARALQVSVILKNSLAFGGNNACLVFRKFRF